MKEGARETMKMPEREKKLMMSEKNDDVREIDSFITFGFSSFSVLFCTTGSRLNVRMDE
jgi:hypothetical protein